MVNRELIRLKVVQIVYSYYKNGLEEKGAQGIMASEKELIFSLDKAYELYQGMLALLLEVRRIAIDDVEQRIIRNKQLGQKEPVDTRLADNRLLDMLATNEQLLEFREKNNQMWIEDEEMIKTLYRNFVQSSDYEEYLDSEDSFKSDKEAIRKFYRSIICGNDAIAAALEDKSIYWNDDSFIVDTFVLKTIKLFQENSTPDMPLLPKYEHTEDLEYAVKLHRHTIENAEYYRSLIRENAKGWDMNRIALIDTVIIQTGLAEIISFPTIPTAVSINEYINISKMYSTPRNYTYVNAALDNISKQLTKEHKLINKK